LHQLQAVTGLVPVLFPDAPMICHHYAEQGVRLRAAATPIAGNDLWIACHALAAEAVLVTNNVGEFGSISNLPVENWV